MSRPWTEEKVLKKLGIPDFRHMTKDKIVKFASILPRMDPAVAKEAIDQFPQFKEMASELTNALKDMVDKAFKSSEESQKYFYDACNNAIAALNKALEDDEIDANEREQIRNHIVQILQMIGDKDSEHKDLVRNVINTAVLGVGFIAASAVAILGGVLLIGSTDALAEDSDTIEGDFTDAN